MSDYKKMLGFEKQKKVEKKESKRKSLSKRYLNERS